MQYYIILWMFTLTRTPRVLLTSELWVTKPGLWHNINVYYMIYKNGILIKNYWNYCLAWALKVIQNAAVSHNNSHGLASNLCATLDQMLGHDIWAGIKKPSSLGHMRSYWNQRPFSALSNRCPANCAACPLKSKRKLIVIVSNNWNVDGNKKLSVCLSPNI